MAPEAAAVLGDCPLAPRSGSHLLGLSKDLAGKNQRRVNASLRRLVPPTLAKMSGAGPSSTSDHCVHQVDHIKKLPDANQAAELLQEIKRHADPLLRARGWRVKKLYEICCCTSGGKNVGVGGFCVPAGDGVTSHRIALRLRQPRSHELHSFEHCMQVMLHEMSHIAHGNHSAQFYQMMEEITKQYETYLAKGQVLDAQGMPMVGGVKMDSVRHNPTSLGEARARAMRAAEARARNSALMGGGKLGSGSYGGGGGGGGGAEWRGKTPGEMAAAAAGARMRAWDVANGLHDAELAAALASQQLDDDDDDEAEKEAKKEAKKEAEAAIAAAAPPPRRRRAAAPPPPAAAPGAASTGISWGARGQGSWQAAGCSVCGPVCKASLHGPGDPPPQDGDEGGGGRGGGGGGGGGGGIGGGGMGGGARGAASGAAGRSGRKEIVEIDLTGSDDEGAPPPAATATVAAASAATALPDAASEQRPARPKRPRDGSAAAAAPTPLQERQPANQGWQPANRGWVCPACTLLNAAASAQCEMECGGVRPVVRPVGAARAGGDKSPLEPTPVAKPGTQPQWPSRVKVPP